MIDILVIGGGPGGASAALVLGRSKLSVLVIDDNSARNIVTHESHGFITNDKSSPEIIKERATNDLKNYPTIDLKNELVLHVSNKEGIFTVKTNKSIYNAKRVILASGYREDFPLIKGLSTVYGKKIFNCVFCDGWELREKPLAVISDNTESLLHFVTMVSHWSKDIIIFTNGNKVNDSEMAVFKNKNIVVDSSIIHEVRTTNDNSQVLIQTTRNDYKVLGGFISPKLIPRLEFLDISDLEKNQSGELKISTNGETSIKNLYVVGDLQMNNGQLVHAASSGSRTAASIVHEIAYSSFHQPQNQ